MLLKTIDKIVHAIMKWVNYLAAIYLSIMVLFVCVYIILRAFGFIIFGTYELVQVASMMIVAFSLGYNEYIDGNVTIDLLDMKFKARGKKLLRIFSVCVTLCICSLTTYFSFAYVFDRFHALATTANLLIPIWIFAVILLFAFATLTIAVLLKLISVIANYSWIGSNQSDVVDI